MSSREKRDAGSKRMGQLLLQGWTMLAEACEGVDAVHHHRLRCATYAKSVERGDVCCMRWEI